MATQKKITTLDLIQQMTDKNQRTANTLENLKRERLDGKQQSKAKNVRKEVLVDEMDDNGQLHNEPLSKTNRSTLNKLDMLLHRDTLKNKKETFFMTMNGDCVTMYEKLAMGISYKMGVKTSRNDLIRKVLTDFTDKNYEKLIAFLESK